MTVYLVMITNSAGQDRPYGVYIDRENAKHWAEHLGGLVLPLILNTDKKLNKD